MPRPRRPTLKSPSKSSKNKIPAPPEPSQTSALLAVASVVRSRGLRGEVALRIDASMAEDLSRGLRLFVEKDGVQTAHTIETLAPYKGGLYVRLSGIADRETAEALRGAVVSAAREDLPALEETQYYAIDLIGCSVTSTAGKPLGEVTEVIATGANDVYVVQGPKGELLVPGIASVVTAIDTETREMTVEPDGLVWPEDPAPTKPKNTKTPPAEQADPK